MSNTENFTHLEGNLVDDPILRYTPTGTPVAQFTIAHNTRRMVDGEWVDGSVSYFDIVAWTHLAEAVNLKLSKGDRVTVEGRLIQRSYENRDGIKVYKIEVNASSVNQSLRFAETHRSVEQTPAPAMAGPVAADYVPDEEPF